MPGAEGLSPSEDLVAIWKSRKGERFQNYKAMFTILNVPVIKRSWLNDLYNNNPFTVNAPEEWVKWVETCTYIPLLAERSVMHRSKGEQMPEDLVGRDIINAICYYFEDGFAFEYCAVEIIKLMDRNIISCDLTQPRRDGGRDAIGEYRLGLESNSISIDFALEAKRYNLNAPVGVKQTSRLIARLRHRQFGFLVTTSYVESQAYKEIIEDGHPVVIISAKDIIDILKKSGYTTKESVEEWLKANFLKRSKP